MVGCVPPGGAKITRSVLVALTSNSSVALLVREQICVIASKDRRRARARARQNSSALN